MLRHIGPITQDNQFRELAFTLFLASLWSKYVSENKSNYFTQKHVTVYDAKIELPKSFIYEFTQY